MIRKGDCYLQRQISRRLYLFFVVEAKAANIGLRKYSNELFNVNLILKEDCKELLPILSSLPPLPKKKKKKIESGLTMEYL